MKRLFTQLVVATLLSIAESAHVDCAIVWGEEAITERQAMQIANNAILKREKDINSFKVDVDTNWNRQLNNQPNVLDYFPEVASKIMGRHFGAVTYSTTVLYRRGGSYTVFVDKENGEVLGVIAWE